MRCTFAGVGEAFDETLPNTSLLIEADESGPSILLDCGFTAAAAFWRVARHPLDLDALWVSHFHGDHCFGIPALLVRSLEQGRARQLVVAGPLGIEQRVLTLMELAYPSFLRKAAFGLRFVEATPGKDVEAAGFLLSTAWTDHSAPCLAVRVEVLGRSLFFSGDGRPTQGTLALALGCDLAVHEAYSLDPEIPGHGTVDGCLEFARKARVGTLALVHVQRDIRRARRPEIEARLAAARDVNSLLPEPGDVWQA